LCAILGLPVSFDMRDVVFISYRRKNSFELAQLVDGALRERGFSTFLDVATEKGGDFGDQVETTIKNCRAFVLICKPGSFDGTVSEDDWILRECSAAVANRKLIIPVLDPAFVVPSSLPDAVARALAFNGVRMSSDFPAAAFDRLATLVGGRRIPTAFRFALLMAALGAVVGAVALVHRVFEPKADPLVGRWGSAVDGDHIEIEIKPQGRFELKLSKAGESTSDTGSYALLAPSRVRLVARSITEECTLSSDRQSLRCGDGQLVLARR
jgi:hypothetical protein